VQEQRSKGQRIGFVPTLGGLHAGHGELIRASAQDGLFTVTSVFVNPAQFGPNEDFGAYPRTEEADLALAAEAGSKLVWFPQVADIYPHGTGKVGTEVGGMIIDPGPMGRVMCGASRPDFFPGIMTVVMKLFNLVQADAGYFGEKDWQQLSLIRSMVEDFHVSIRVESVPTQRDPDGLAMSTRNKYLRPADREIALSLSRAIALARTCYRDGLSAHDCADRVRRSFPAELELDYVDLRNGRTLQLVEHMDDATRIFLAGWMDGVGSDGKSRVRVRLIDNDSVSM
jgi:pantoate--beta-alanine ligase